MIHPFIPPSSTSLLKKAISRRRCLNIIATSCTAGIAGLSGIACANTSQPASNKGQHKLTWSGILLGANTSITLFSDNPETAKTSITNMLKQIEILENYFSLYKTHSLINRLNQQGSLDNPPAEFYELISFTKNFAEATDGNFDPTIQPLFIAYKNLSRQNKSSAHPWSETETVKSAKELINWQNINLSKTNISFKKTGMALTLNGVAQGYITDKAVQILKSEGYENTLVNFGEYFALGQYQSQKSDKETQPQTDGKSNQKKICTSQTPLQSLDWRLQLGQNAINSDTKRPIWSVKNQALAASDRSGFIFDVKSGLHHMIAPKTGGNQQAWNEIYVLAKNATIADATSTALFASDPQDLNRIFRATNASKALIINQDGIHQSL